MCVCVCSVQDLFKELVWVYVSYPKVKKCVSNSSRKPGCTGKEITYQPADGGQHVLTLHTHTHARTHTRTHAHARTHTHTYILSLIHTRDAWHFLAFTYTVQKLGWDLFNVFERSLLYSARLHLFDQKYNKIRNIVKYYSCGQSWIFSIMLHSSVLHMLICCSRNIYHYQCWKKKYSIYLK